MSELFADKPNVVEVVIQDKSGQSSFFVAGKEIDDVIQTVKTALQDGTKTTEQKTRRKRRTKAELLAARNEAMSQSIEDTPDRFTRRGRKPKNLWANGEKETKKEEVAA